MRAAYGHQDQYGADLFASDQGRHVNNNTRLNREADLGGNETWLRAVLKNMVDGVITIDGQGIIQTINPAAERIFGYSGDDVTGHNIRTLAAEPYPSACYSSRMTNTTPVPFSALLNHPPYHSN